MAPFPWQDPQGAARTPASARPFWKRAVGPVPGFKVPSEQRPFPSETSERGLPARPETHTAAPRPQARLCAAFPGVAPEGLPREPGEGARLAPARSRRARLSFQGAPERRGGARSAQGSRALYPQTGQIPRAPRLDATPGPPRGAPHPRPGKPHLHLHPVPLRERAFRGLPGVLPSSPDPISPPGQSAAGTQSLPGWSPRKVSLFPAPRFKRKKERERDAKEET